jgi:hypothetical protein
MVEIVEREEVRAVKPSYFTTSVDRKLTSVNDERRTRDARHGHALSLGACARRFGP